MLKKHLNTSTRLFWTREEIEELRNCMQTNDIAPVDSLMFGKRFSEIISRGRDKAEEQSHVANDAFAPL